MIDTLFVNGKYPDYREGAMKYGNIGVEKGKITYIGMDQPEAAEVIDISGKVISPGFIDIHMHEENFAEEGEKYVIADMMLEMGVTTAVGGNCGIQRQRLKDFKETIKRLGGSPVNYMMLTGYNQCRYALNIGSYEKATPEQMNKIREMLKDDLNEGAIGISFGIEYDPGMDMEEILYGIGVTDNPDLMVAVHYRADCLENIDSIFEMIDIANNIPLKFQISHLSSCSAMGLMKESLDAINEAMEKNPRLNYDTYPYNAFSTKMGSTVFEDGCLEGWKKDYKDILLTDDPYKDVRCTKEIFEDARENYPEMLAVAFVMNEDEIREAIVNKNGMIGSDGIINHGNGHPRAAGTFPRVLGKYVREEKAVSLVDALRKMTFEPAERLLLHKKGRIEEGCDADLVIFNPETVHDGATFSDLHIKPVGIEYVYINGEKAVEQNKIVNDRSGQFIPYRNELI